MLPKPPPGLEIWLISQDESAQEAKTTPQPKQLQNPQPQRPAGPPPEDLKVEAELPDDNTAPGQVKIEQDAASTEAHDSEDSDERDKVQNLFTFELEKLTLNVVEGEDSGNTQTFNILGRNVLYDKARRQLTMDVMLK